MNKITELRRNVGKPVYVKDTDYTFKKSDENSIIINFKKDFQAYYGAKTHTITGNFLYDKLTPIELRKKVRDIIRYRFKQHIISYIAEQQKLLGMEIPKSNITNEITKTSRDKIKGEIMKGKNIEDKEYPDFEEDIKHISLEAEIESDIFNGSFDFEDNVPVLEESKFDSVALDDFEFEEEEDCFDKIEEFKDDDFKTIKEEVIFEEFEEVKTDDFDFTDDLSHSPTLPAAQVIEYFETLFTTQIEPSSPIVDYITEASAKLKYLTYEAETKQKITDKEKEIQSLKSLLKLNTEIMNKSNNRLKEIKNKLK